MPERVGRTIERLQQAQKLGVVKRLADELGSQLSQLLQQRNPETSELMQEHLRTPRKPAGTLDVKSVRYGVHLGLTAVANHIVDSRRNMRKTLALLAEDLRRKDGSSAPDGLTELRLATSLKLSLQEAKALVDILLLREYVAVEGRRIVLTADGMEKDALSPKKVGGRREAV